MAVDHSVHKRVNLSLENLRLRRRVTKLEDEIRFLTGTFLASAYATHFHRENCKWAAEISPQNLIEFSSHEEAVEAGYKPCKTCRS